MTRIDIANGLFIQVFEPGEMPFPIIGIISGDHPNVQIMPVWPREIKALIAALTEAAVWLADEWAYEHNGIEGA